MLRDYGWAVDYFIISSRTAGVCQKIIQRLKRLRRANKLKKAACCNKKSQMGSMWMAVPRDQTKNGRLPHTSLRDASDLLPCHLVCIVLLGSG